MGVVNACSTCRFLVGADCHRYPAKVRVMPAHWCGEWTPDVATLPPGQIVEWRPKVPSPAFPVTEATLEELGDELLKIGQEERAKVVAREAARPPKKPGRKPYT